MPFNQIVLIFFFIFKESQKPKNIKDPQTDMGPSTSKGGEIPSRAFASETKQKTEVDSGDTGEDSDAGMYFFFLIDIILNIL